MWASISASVVTAGPGDSSAPRYGSNAFCAKISRVSLIGVAEFAPIAFGREVVEQDARRLPRIRRRERDRAARGRAHRAHVRLEAVLVDLLPAVVGDRDRQEVVLQVRVLHAGAAADEAAGLEVIGRAEARPEQQPFDADGALGDEVLRRMERDRLRARVLHVGFDVVLQVRADAGNVRHRRDAELLQRVGVADAGQHQDLRRIDRAAGDDDFAARAHPDEPAVVQVLDADGARALEQDAGDQAPRLDAQIRARPGRSQVGHRGAPAAAPVGRHVHRTEAFLPVAVHVVGLRVPGLPSRVDERAIERILHRARGDVERAAAAAIVVGALAAAFPRA